MPANSAKKFKVNKKTLAQKKQRGVDYKSLLLPITAIVIVFSLGFTIYTVKTAAQPPTEREFLSCRVDNDCVQVPADCCGCENGGKSMAVSRKFRGYFAEKRANECKNTACLTVYLCEEGVKPRCVQGRCTLRTDQPPK